jgi:predicted ATPase
MIEGFRLVRFRGFEDTRWLKLPRLTLLFGHNSSGKSSLLAALLMLRQSLLNPDRLTPFVLSSDLGVDLGSYWDVVFEHQDDPLQPVTVEVLLRLRGPYTGLGREIDRLIIQLQIGYDRQRKITILRSVEILDVGGAKLFEVARKHRVRPNRSPWRIQSHAFKMRELPGLGEIEWSNFLPLIDPTSLSYKSVRELCDVVAQQFKQDFGSLTHIGPLRTEPERVYYFTGESVSEVGHRGENTYKLLAAVRYQGQQEELKQRLNRWLEALGYRLDVRVFGTTPVLQIEMREIERGPNAQPYNLKDVGFGLSQVLPVIVQCYCGVESRMILLEQPELHLHPRAQADLGDLLIDALKDGHRFIIETHSEHILLRLRRRIAETTVKPTETQYQLKPDDLAVYFVDRWGGKSRVNEVAVNEVGQIPAPPEGFRRFFSDDYDEMMVIAEMAAAHAKEDQDS